MICQECQQRPATLHFTKIINGEKSEVHLCEVCAQEKGEMFSFPGNAGFSINNLLGGLLNTEPLLNKNSQNAFAEQKVIQCDNCKMTYNQFAKVGRFGCSHCYKAFQARLEPIVKRLHSGNAEHAGKVPKRIGGSIHVKKELASLKAELRDLINQEEFEQAAQVRDRIRALEKKLSKEEEA